MHYVKIDTGPWDSDADSWWIRLLKRILPAANPDLEDQLYPKTTFWWIELDDRRVPQREIGFDESSNPIVLGPVGRNYGFAVDQSAPLQEPLQLCSEAEERFQATWDHLWPQFEHLEKGANSDRSDSP